MAADIVARRTVWLKHWEADNTARANLATRPFAGGKLSGDETLKEVLVDPKERRKPYMVTVRAGASRENMPPTTLSSPFEPLDNPQEVETTNPPPATHGLDPTTTPSSVQLRDAAQTTQLLPPSMAVGPVVSDTLHIGGHLLCLAPTWEDIGADALVLNTVTRGYSLEFSHPPHPRYISSRLPGDQPKKLNLSATVQHLVEIQAVEEIEQSQMQDGIPSLHQGSPAGMQLPGLHRFEGGISPHTDPSWAQEVSEVLAWAPSLSVQSPAFWPLVSPEGVHKDHGGHSGPSPASGSIHLSVPQRPALEQEHFTVRPGPCAPYFNSPQQTGLPSQP
ncbi:uncharacterized protein LOC133377199 [Rhineura floridana]|uniref:uncharacterized protein LOC133377199 n=1 Tax=Rhineura floridana TaxID=261503 RepID=UPI002AC7F552|nr:uncharacterized protein LOC133377199 [Rhineura floridana]